ncbi:hypothetical protein SteCoe_4490 [Stentor coeruleus]|uniref:Uncharacterized protein n=1 Tax=Stentor coeruleus TaxID=5963 RepID=A0A1R2CUN4_9CILI|nr:hypothetical protein SteCoe_4490 [Stentor coeruleus]
MSSFQYKKRQSITNFHSSHKFSLLDLRKDDCPSPLLLRPKNKSTKLTEQITLSPKQIARKPKISIIRAKKANISFNIHHLDLTSQLKPKSISISPPKKLKFKPSKKFDLPISISSNSIPYKSLNFEIHNTSKFTRINYSHIDTINRPKIRISIKMNDMQKFFNPDEDYYSGSEESMFPKMK